MIKIVPITKFQIIVKCDRCGKEETNNEMYDDKTLNLALKIFEANKHVCQDCNDEMRGHKE